MSNAVWLGVALILLGGILNGSFALPMKFMPKWPWEATWLIFSITGLVLVPVTIALVTLPSLAETYALTSWRSLGLTALFGFGWGIGAVLFGVGLARLGMSLGFSIILGLAAALGSLIPMLVIAPHEIATRKGGTILVGLGIVLLGIYLCGKAFGIKEQGTESQSVGAAGRELRGGLVICIAAGILIAMLNLAFAFGNEIAEHAVEIGATSTSAANAIWVLALAAGVFPNVGYCLLLLVRNRSTVAFFAPGTAHYWVMGVLMGILWMTGLAVYGLGAARVGALGAVVGWPLLQSTIIVTANVLGWLTGEWSTAPRAARRMMVLGLTVLTIAIFIIGHGSSLQEGSPVLVD